MGLLVESVSAACDDGDHSRTNISRLCVAAARGALQTALAGDVHHGKRLWPAAAALVGTEAIGQDQSRPNRREEIYFDKGVAANMALNIFVSLENY